MPQPPSRTTLAPLHFKKRKGAAPSSWEVILLAEGEAGEGDPGGGVLSLAERAAAAGDR